MGLPSARSIAFSTKPDAQALRQRPREKRRRADELDAVGDYNGSDPTLTVAVVAREQDPVRTTALTGDVDQFGNGDSGPISHVPTSCLFRVTGIPPDLNLIAFCEPSRSLPWSPEEL